jgi:predicted  nucleic acid-binding Zn-ribbon protein
METLRDLADVETELGGIERNLAPYRERRKGEEARCAPLARRVEEKVRALTAVRSTLRALEADLEDLESRLVEERRKIDAISSLRAAQAAEASLVGLTERRGTLEERILEAMEVVENAERDAGAARDEEAAAGVALGETVAALEAAEESARSVRAALVAKREALLALLPADLGRKVRALVDRGISPAVALAQATHCPACKASIKANALAHLRAGHPSACDQCGRILVSL